MPKKPLNELTSEEWEALVASGMAWEFYPEGPPEEFCPEGLPDERTCYSRQEAKANTEAD